MKKDKLSAILLSAFSSCSVLLSFCFSNNEQELIHKALHLVMNPVPLVFFFAIAFIYYKWLRNISRFSFVAAILSSLFSLLFLISACINPATHRFVKPPIILLIVSFFGISVFIYSLLDIFFSKLDSIQSCVPSCSRKSTLRYFFILMLLWLPYVILCWPGNMPWDTGSSLLYSLDIDKSNVNNPYFQNVLFGLIYRIGELIGNIHIGIAIYTTLQLVAYALCISIILNHFSRFCPFVCIIVLLVLGLLPVFPVYAFCIGKDSNFALLVLAFSFSMTLFIEKPVEFLSRNTNLILLFFISFLLSLLRNHAYIIPLTCFLFCIPLYIKAARAFPWKLAILFVSILSVNLALPRVFNIPDPHIAESLSIPLQQTAYYVNNYSNEVTEKEYLAIDAVIPYDILSNYNSGNADPVKNQFKKTVNNESLRNYWYVWGTQLLKHPEAYAKAFYYMTYAYYSPLADRFDLKPHIITGFDIDRSIYKLTNLKQHPKTGVHIVKKLNTLFTESPITGIFQRIGIYSWLLIGALCYLLSRRRFRMLIPFIPSLIIIIGCCLSPINGYYRYAFPMILSVFIVGLPLLFYRKE